MSGGLLRPLGLATVFGNRGGHTVMSEFCRTRFDALLGPAGPRRTRKPIEPLREPAGPKQDQSRRIWTYAERRRLVDPWKRARQWERQVAPHLRPDGATPYLVALRAMRDGAWHEGRDMNAALGAVHWTGYAVPLVKWGMVEVSRESGQLSTPTRFRAQKKRDRWRITPIGLAFVEMLD